MPRPDRRRYPLRLIVAVRVDEHSRLIERLACGHEQPERRDIFGPTNAVRRRCWRCAKG